MRGERKCVLCGTQYIYCPHCKDDPKETWRFLYCSDNCRDVYHIIELWIAKKLTSVQARNQLEKCTLPPMEDIKEALRKNIEQIYKESEGNDIPKEQLKKRGRKKKILVNED